MASNVFSCRYPLVFKSRSHVINKQRLFCFQLSTVYTSFNPLVSLCYVVPSDDNSAGNGDLHLFPDFNRNAHILVCSLIMALLISTQYKIMSGKCPFLDNNQKYMLNFTKFILWTSDVIIMSFPTGPMNIVNVYI